ncbi:MAG: ComF family protein [Candidatus Kapaibacterium sp.]|nr:MAG: ComF family protein [Candidatus Kapabacteria bacterium]
MKFLDSLRDAFNFIIAPPICILCSSLIDTRLWDSAHICKDCFQHLPPSLNSETILTRFTRNFPESPNPFSFAFSLFDSSNNQKYLEIIHYLKYTKFKKIGYFLGTKLGEHIYNEIEKQGFNIDFIVPVPIHKLRRRERGFNQSEIISEAISQVTSIPVEFNLIKRNIYTQSQTQLNFDERKKNVENAFVLGKSSNFVQGKNFLLVDDIITTGSTLFNCAKLLKSVGANEMFLAVLTTA